MDVNEEILITLEEIRKWVRFSGWSNVKEVLEKTLDEPEKIIAYSMTDGKQSIRKINESIGKSFGTIQRWWKSWSQIGIAEQVEAGRGTRAKAQFNLEEFGIEIPSINIGKKEIPEKDDEDYE